MGVECVADHLPCVRVIQRRDRDGRPVLPLRLPLIAQQRAAPEVVDAPEAIRAANRPVHRRRGNAKRLLEVVHQLQRILGRPVELVDEGENRQPVAPADLEELPRLGLDTIGRVDDHHNAVGGDEGPVGVLAEVVVSRRIDERHAPALQLELECRGRDGDAALLLHFHPVRGGMAAGVPSTHGAG